MTATLIALQSGRSTLHHTEQRKVARYRGWHLMVYHNGDNVTWEIRRGHTVRDDDGSFLPAHFAGESYSHADAFEDAEQFIDENLPSLL